MIIYLQKGIGATEDTHTRMERVIQVFDEPRTSIKTEDSECSTGEASESLEMGLATSAACKSLHT